MSTIADARYSTVSKPELKVLACSILSSSASGIGAPVWWWTANLFSTSGVRSQFSLSWEGNSTKSRATLVPARVG